MLLHAMNSNVPDTARKICVSRLRWARPTTCEAETLAYICFLYTVRISHGIHAVFA